MTDLQERIQIKARELHNEHCVKDCERVIGSWWLVWAEGEIAAEQMQAALTPGDPK